MKRITVVELIILSKFISIFPDFKNLEFASIIRYLPKRISISHMAYTC